MPSSRSSLAGTKPSWATSKALVRHASPTQTVGFRIYLGWRNGAAAEALAAAVSNPRSCVVSALPLADPVPGAVCPDRSGRGSRPELAQGKRFQGHGHPGEPTLHRRPGHCEAGGGRVPNDPEHVPGVGSGRPAPSTTLSVPASIAGKISGAIGIDESYNFVHTNTVIDKKAPPSAGFRNAPPLSTYWAQFVSPYAYPTGFTDVTDPATAPWTVRGYTPAQIKGAYGSAARTTAPARPSPSSTPTPHRPFSRTSTSGRRTVDFRR